MAADTDSQVINDMRIFFLISFWDNKKNFPIYKLLDILFFLVFFFFQKI